MARPITTATAAYTERRLTGARNRLRVPSLVRDAFLPLPPESLGVPLQLAREASEPSFPCSVQRHTLLVEGLLHLRHRQRAGDTGHPHFCDHFAQHDGRARTAEHPRRVRHDRRRPPEILFEEMIEQVRERGRNAVVVLARYDDERVGGAVERGEPLERFRRAAFRILLVHSVEQRKLDLDWIDQRHSVSARFETSPHEPSGTNPLPVASNRPVNDNEVQRHVDTILAPCPAETAVIPSPRCGNCRGTTIVSRARCTRRARVWRCGSKWDPSPSSRNGLRSVRGPSRGCKRCDAR